MSSTAGELGPRSPAVSFGDSPAQPRESAGERVSLSASGSSFTAGCDGFAFASSRSAGGHFFLVASVILVSINLFPLVQTTRFCELFSPAVVLIWQFMLPMHAVVCLECVVIGLFNSGFGSCISAEMIIGLALSLVLEKCKMMTDTNVHGQYDLAGAP